MGKKIDLGEYLERMDLSRFDNPFATSKSITSEPPKDPRKELESQGYNWITNMDNREADLLEEECKESGIDYQRQPAFARNGSHIPSMSAIYLKEGMSLAQVWQKLGQPEREGNFPQHQYHGSIDEVLAIQTHEWGITKADARRPVIATDCVNTCMAIAGYEPNKQEAFLVHFAETSDAQNTLRAIEQDLRSDNKYQLWIIGGTGKGQKSREEELVALFTGSTVLNGRFVGKDMYGGGDSVRSIALDSRDGKVYTFRGLGPINVDNGQFALYRTPAIKVENK